MKAAQGGLMIPRQPLLTTWERQGWTPTEEVLLGNMGPKRRYPFGDEVEAELANYAESRLNVTGAVGCFGRGASPYGVVIPSIGLGGVLTFHLSVSSEWRQAKAVTDVTFQQDKFSRQYAGTELRPDIHHALQPQSHFLDERVIERLAMWDVAHPAFPSC